MNRIVLSDLNRSAAKPTDLAEFEGGYEPEPQPAASMRPLLVEILMAAYRRRWLIAAVVAATLAAVVAITLLQTPIYRATATLQIDRDVKNVVDISDVGQTISNDAEFYQTQYEILRSRALSYRVISDLGLAEPERLEGLANPRLFSLAPIFALLRGGGDEELSPEERVQGASSILLNQLSVTPVRNSRIVAVGYDSTDPVRAAEIANAFAEAYVRYNLDLRSGVNTIAREVLEDRIASAKAKLEDSEKALVEYAQAERISESQTSEEAGQTNLKLLNEALVKAQADRASAEAEWRSASAVDPMTLPGVIQNETIQVLRSEQAKLEAEYRQKLTIFKPDFPEMKELANQIASLEAAIAAEAGKIRSGIRGRFEVAADLEAKLKREIELQTDDLFGLRGRMIRYTILQREVETNRTVYDGLLQRFKEISAIEGTEANNVTVIDRAEAPRTAHSPNLTINLAFGLLAALALAGLATYIAELVDNGIHGVEEVEQRLGLASLGIIPMARRTERTDVVDIGDKSSAFSEAIRSIRTSLQFASVEGIPRVLMVTSSRPSEGKTTISGALSVNFALLGLRVCAVDADLRKPSLHKVLGVDNDSGGLSNVLTGAKGIEEVLKPTRFENVTIMTGGPSPPNPVELLSGPRADYLFRTLESQFDVVIVDASPVLNLSDALILSKYARGLVLIAEAHRTPFAMVANTVRRLRGANAPILGAVLNKVSLDRGGQGYGYGYGYGYGLAYGSTNDEPKDRRGAASGKLIGRG